MFQFGGLLSLGANTAVMGCAALCGYGARLVFRGRLPAVAAFLAGFCAVIAGSVLIVAALTLSANELRPTAALIMAANIPLAAVEGVLTSFIVLFIARIKPSVLEPAAPAP